MGRNATIALIAAIFVFLSGFAINVVSEDLKDRLEDNLGALYWPVILAWIGLGLLFACWIAVAGLRQESGRGPSKQIRREFRTAWPALSQSLRHDMAASIRAATEARRAANDPFPLQLVKTPGDEHRYWTHERTIRRYDAELWVSIDRYLRAAHDLKVRKTAYNKVIYDCTLRGGQGDEDALARAGKAMYDAASRLERWVDEHLEPVVSRYDEAVRRPD